MKIKTIGDLARTDRVVLLKKFGKYGNTLWEYANGIDNTCVNNREEEPKSIGNSVTLPIDISSTEKIKEVILKLTEQVAYRLRKHNLKANTVNVQLRTSDFKDFSHQKKLDYTTSNTKDIYNKAIKIINEMYKDGLPIRLIGVRVDNLVNEESEQISFFTDKNNEKQEKLDKVLDTLKEKYGYDSIKRARNIDKLE